MIFIVLSSRPKAIARVHSVHMMNVEQRQATADLQTKPRDLAVSPPAGCYRLQSPSPFIIITQPERWHSFSQWCSPQDQGLPYGWNTSCRNEAAFYSNAATAASPPAAKRNPLSTSFHCHSNDTTMKVKHQLHRSGIISDTHSWNVQWHL